MRILRTEGVAYGSRKLASYAQALAYFILLEAEVEESGDQQAIQLWVQAFKDRQTFVKNYLKELESTNTEVAKMMEGTGCSSGCPTCTCSQATEEPVEKENVPEQPWEEIENVINDMFDRAENYDEAEVRKVLMLHNETNKTEQNLSVSHTNSKTCFLKKSFSDLGLPQEHPLIIGPKKKVFVKKISKVLAAQGGCKGAKHTQSVFCYQINIQHFSQALRQRILGYFDQAEIIPEEGDIESTQSQNFEEYHQSPDGLILYCRLCDHQAGSVEDLRTHTNQDHARCQVCKRVFEGEDTLQEHIDSDHSMKTCHICDEEIETSKFRVHMTSHRQKEGFKRALEEVGKIKQKTAESKREKIDLRAAYKMFTEENKAATKAFVDEEYEEMNAKEKSQQVTKVTAQLWKQKTQKEKEDYAKKRAEDLKRLREASERGENVMNLTESDGRVQRLIVCQQCGKVCLGEQKFMKHQTEDHGQDNLEEEIRTGPGQVDIETSEKVRGSKFL